MALWKGGAHYLPARQPGFVPAPSGAPKLLGALHGSLPEARARLRRPKDVQCTIGEERDLDRFSSCMAPRD